MQKHNHLFLDVPFLAGSVSGLVNVLTPITPHLQDLAWQVGKALVVLVVTFYGNKYLQKKHS